MEKKSDLQTKVERLDVKLGALPSSTSRWSSSEKLALYGMAREVVSAFFAEREPREDPDDDLDLSEAEDRAQTDVDVTVATKDGRVTVSFAVDAADLDILGSFISLDMLNKIAVAVRDKMAPLQNATPE